MNGLLYIYFLAFVLGAILGSFVNVLIYRIPRDISVIFPFSACPHCKKRIRWYENIPIVSFIFLRGKCSKCKKRISFRYPAVEFLTGIVCLYLFPDYLTAETILEYVFMVSVFCVFIAHFFIDLEFEILPNSLNLYLALIFLIHSMIFKSYTYWLFGALIGFCFPLTVIWLFYLIRGKVGMGMGDIKLYGALGLYLGPEGIIYNIFFSCFLGSVVGIGLILLKRMDKNKPIPFGPYIVVVALIQIFFPSVLPFLLGR